MLSKFLVETEDLLAGYSFFQEDKSNIPFFRSSCNVANTEGDPKTVSSSPGGRFLSKVSLRTCEPTSIRRWQNLAKLVLSFVKGNFGCAVATERKEDLF